MCWTEEIPPTAVLPAASTTTMPSSRKHEARACLHAQEPRAAGPPKPIWAGARPEHSIEAAWVPPPRGGHASTVVGETCSPPGSRRSTLPNYHRATPRRRQGGSPPPREGRPRRRRHRPGHICSAGPLAAVGGMGRGGGGPQCGGAVGPRVA